MKSVGIIGAGISGSCCARGLRMAKPDLRATVYEMGQGAGGRLSTRRSRGSPHEVNHGTPAFTIQSPKFAALMKPLLDAGAVIPWRARLGILDGRNGFAEEVDIPELTLYRGHPRMADICSIFIEQSQCKTVFEQQCASLDFSESSRKWELRGRSGELLGIHDFLVVSSSILAHDRWRQIFGSEPPLQRVARIWEDRCPEMHEAVTRVQEVGSRPVLSLIFAFDGSEGLWADELPFDIMNVMHHPMLSKVVRQRTSSGTSVIVHSSHEFARIHANAWGHKSSIARFTGSDEYQASATEKEVRGMLWRAFASAVTGIVGSPPPKPDWGTFLHRWGSAFPEHPSDDKDSTSLLVDGMGLAFCGDYIKKPLVRGHFVEAAALSGIEAAEFVAAQV